MASMTRRSLWAVLLGLICAPVGTALGGDICELPLDIGPCDGVCPRWGFDSCSGQCVQFDYGCCEGNANNFETEKACQAACPTQACGMSIDPGPCDGICPRWGYNACTGQCEEFTWGCCGGNANNFMTEAACQSACPLPAETCEQGLDPGICGAAFKRYGHNPCTGQCEAFTWGGCGGNSNNFLSMAECESACGANSVCSFPLDQGDCTAAIPRWGFSGCTGQCELFMWGGCGGNANNFETLSECQGLCEEFACLSVADCADTNADGIRDDNCVWSSCDGGICTALNITFADMGGPGGACLPDGTADGNDRFHALNCFANQDTLGNPGYPCAENPPAAYNVDAGGPTGSCSPDGVCDGNDVFHALNAFEGTSTCSCPGDAPTPQHARRQRARHKS